jgi:hypothetical protein
LKKIRQQLESINGLFTLTAISSILYYCGYLSVEYHEKVLGIYPSRTPIDYLKGGADFFIYSIVDFSSKFFDLLPIVLFNFSWIHCQFYWGIILVILYKSSANIKRSLIFEYFVLAYVLVLALLSLMNLNLIISKSVRDSLINYSRFKDYNILYKTYWVILACNIIGCYLLYKIPQRSRSSIPLIVSLLLLPAFYGIYGKGYVYPYSNPEVGMLIGEDLENFYLIKVIDTVPISTVSQRQYIILPKDKCSSFQYQQTHNFFDFISSSVK